MNYKEEFDKYNLLDKEVLIGMLIEIHRDKSSEITYSHDDCGFYQAGSDTSGRCMVCNKSKYEHKGITYTNS